MPSSTKDLISQWPGAGDIWQMGPSISQGFQGRVVPDFGTDVWQMGPFDRWRESSRSLEGMSFGDIWGDIVSALPSVVTAGTQIYTAEKNADIMSTLAARGVMPSYYQNGIPVYSSPPAGVTPSNPYSLPSGMALPYGVSPNQTSYYPWQPGYQSPNFMSDPNLPMYAAIGGGALLLLLIATKR